MLQNGAEYNSTEVTAMPFADWLVFCLAAGRGRPLGRLHTWRDSRNPLRCGRSSAPEKRCAQSTVFEIELLSKTDGQTGIIGRRYIIKVFFIF